MKFRENANADDLPRTPTQLATQFSAFTDDKSSIATFGSTVESVDKQKLSNDATSEHWFRNRVFVRDALQDFHLQLPNES
jgi:hypothetical protein